VMAPSEPPRPAIVVLLMSMVNEKQPYILRCAVLYCFQCYLYKNEAGQRRVVETLLPSSTDDAQSLSAGQLLCGGLFSKDPLSNWFAATALKSAISDNDEMKRQLLRVQLATSIGQPPTTLLQQCCNMLQSPQLKTRLGILLCLCTWVASCAPAVAAFLAESTNVAYLISQISSSEGDDNEVAFQGVCALLLGITVHFNDDAVPNFSRSALITVIKQRIGMETFFDKLGFVTKLEAYNVASKHTAPDVGQRGSETLLFDWGFTRLFKSLEASVTASVTQADSSATQPIVPKELTPEAAEAQKESEKLLQQYQTSLAERDQQLVMMQQQMAALSAQKTALETYAKEAQEAIQQLQEQNIMLRASQGGESGENAEAMNREIGELKLELVRLEQAKSEDDCVIEGLRSEVQSLAIGAEQPTETDKEREMRSIIEELSGEMENLKGRVILQDEDVAKYKAQYETVFSQLQAMEEQRRVLEETENAAGEKLNEDEASNYLERIKSANMERLETQEKLNSMEITVRQTSQENQDLRIELESLRKDQDDFFVLLSSEEEKKNKYRDMLKKLNVELSDSSEDEDGEGEDLGDEDDEADPGV